MTLTSASSLFLNNAAKRQLQLFIITEYWLSLIPAEFKAVSEQMCWMHHKNPERMMEANSTIHLVCVGVTKLLLNSKTQSSHQRLFFHIFHFSYSCSLSSPFNDFVHQFAAPKRCGLERGTLVSTSGTVWRRSLHHIPPQVPDRRQSADVCQQS